MTLHRLAEKQLVEQRWMNIGLMALLIAAALIPAILSPAIGSMDGIPVGAVMVAKETKMKALDPNPFMSASRFNQGELSEDLVLAS